MDADEVLRVEDAVLVLASRVYYLGREVLALVLDVLAERVLDGGVVALDEDAIDEAHRERRLACGRVSSGSPSRRTRRAGERGPDEPTERLPTMATLRCLDGGAGMGGDGVTLGLVFRNYTAATRLTMLRSAVFKMLRGSNNEIERSGMGGERGGSRSSRPPPKRLLDSPLKHPKLRGVGFTKGRDPTFAAHTGIGDAAPRPLSVWAVESPRGRQGHESSMCTSYYVRKVCQSEPHAAPSRCLCTGIGTAVELPSAPDRRSTTGSDAS